MEPLAASTRLPKPPRPQGLPRGLHERCPRFPGRPPGHQCHRPCHPTTAVPGASSQQLELGKASVPRGWKGQAACGRGGAELGAWRGQRPGRHPGVLSVHLHFQEVGTPAVAPALPRCLRDPVSGTVEGEVPQLLPRGPREGDDGALWSGRARGHSVPWVASRSNPIGRTASLKSRRFTICPTACQSLSLPPNLEAGRDLASLLTWPSVLRFSRCGLETSSPSSTSPRELTGDADSQATHPRAC